MPHITVCIPTHNHKEYLMRALQSVYRQTFTDYEIVIVDDGSTDGTEQMLKENGYKVVPVNSRVVEILGEPSYPDLSFIPEPVDVVDIFRRSEEVACIVEEAIGMGLKAVWIQGGVINEEASTRAKEAGLLVVMDRCMLKEHRKLKK